MIEHAPRHNRRHGDRGPPVHRRSSSLSRLDRDRLLRAPDGRVGTHLGRGDGVGPRHRRVRRRPHRRERRRLQLRAHRAGRVTARRGRDGRRRAADPQATGRPSEHDADAARRRAPARRATRHPVGIRGEHLPAIRLRPGFAEGERPTRPSSQRLSPAACLQRPGPPGDRGRGKDRLPAGLRRGEADPRRILHPHPRVLEFGGLPLSARVAARTRGAVQRRARRRRHDRRLCAVRDPRWRRRRRCRSST